LMMMVISALKVLEYYDTRTLISTDIDPTAAKHNAQQLTS